MTYFGLFFTFLFGTVIGSFLSVVIFRLPTNESIALGRSHCPKCHNNLPWFTMVPVASYAALGGKCYLCKNRIPLTYPLVEIMTGSLFVLAFWLSFVVGTLPLPVALVTFAYLATFFALLTALFFIDLFYLLLLDVLVFPALLLTMLYHAFLYFVYPVALGQLSHVLWGYGVGLTVALAFLAVIVASKGKGMGGGDVKYALVLGAATGWPNVGVALFSAFISGAIAGLALIALRRKTMKETIPFGPFLIGGTVFAMVYGTPVVDFYMATILR